MGTGISGGNTKFYKKTEPMTEEITIKHSDLMTYNVLHFSPNAYKKYWVMRFSLRRRCRLCRKKRYIASMF